MIFALTYLRKPLWYKDLRQMDGPRSPKSFGSKDLRRFCTANCVPKKTGPKPRALVPILRHPMKQRKN